MTSGKTCIINQFAGLGDIIFIMPLVRRYIDKGYRIVWPVVPAYVGISKHFPEVEFIDKTRFRIDYNSKARVESESELIIPLRWSDQIVNVPYWRCMESKYLMEDVPLEEWRSSYWKRDYNSENRLFDLLGLSEGEEYCLVNNTFKTEMNGKVSIA